MASELWAVIRERLEKGETVAAATIATRDGSAPRGAGAKMLVGKGGLLAGTLGGGLGEARAIAEAMLTLGDGRTRLLDVDMTGSARDGADLICGGRVRIFIERLVPGRIETYRAVADRLRDGATTFLLTPVDGTPPTLVLPGAEDALGRAVLEERPASARLFRHGGTEFFLEPVYGRTRLVLAGGGHVSRATARVAALVDFEVTVLDDRAEFADPRRFDWLDAERVKVAPEFAECFGEKLLGFPVAANCFVAVLTRGHSHDGEVLAQALRTEAGYVGMIGSRRKRDAIYAMLLERGFSRADLERVHSPIGLSLGAETPEEIAVGIVAEIIAARSRAKNGS